MNLEVKTDNRCEGCSLLLYVRYFVFIQILSIAFTFQYMCYCRTLLGKARTGQRERKGGPRDGTESRISPSEGNSPTSSFEVSWKV